MSKGLGCLAVLLLFGSLAYAQSSPTPLLTTQTQSGGPTIFVNGSGSEVKFKGLGWYGFNIGFAAPENLTKGYDAMSQDFKTIVYRQKQLGFNAIRLAFTFDDKLGIRSPFINYTRECAEPTDIKSSLTPNSSVYGSYSIPSGWSPTATPPALNNSICNSYLPTNTYQRFIWMVNYYISQGFYVNLDFHSNMYQEEGSSPQYSFYNQSGWIENWSELLTDILATPANKGKLLVDLINEPDGYNLTWEGNGTANSSLTSYYVNAIDALYPVCPDCLFLVEGGGDYHWCGVNWGNGFITNQTMLSIYKEAYNLSDATVFFNSIMSKPWLKQMVLAPHIYCPGVTDATTCFSGQQLYDGLDLSFGYLTVSPGWCESGNCRVFPVILDEFGSTFNNSNEIACMQSIETYVNALAPTSTSTHSPITSWFYWAYQPDSSGTGGIVANDWRTIMWNKISALTGGINSFEQGWGLVPWYLVDGFSSLSSNSTATTG